MRRVGRVIAIAGVLTVACSSGNAPQPPEPTPAPSGPQLSGVYTARIGNFITDNNQELPDGAGAFDLVIRSVCTDDGCVATATAPNAHRASALQAERAAAELVLDYVDGQWIAVETWTGECTPADGSGRLQTANWDSFILDPQPDGTLVGEYTGRGALETCAGSTRQRLTMTRTGDVDPDYPLPDPALLPPRKASAASGFHGMYEYTSVNVTPNVPAGTPGGAKLTYTATTVCLRTGDRCLTYLLTKEGYSRALTFADGKWTEQSAPFPGACAPSGTATKVRRGEFTLPPSPSDPIAEVQGMVSEQALDGPCKGTSEFTNTLRHITD